MYPISDKIRAKTKLVADVATFVATNAYLGLNEYNYIITALWNALYLHRIALANHYIQHYLPNSALYRIFRSLLLISVCARTSHIEHHRYFNTKRDPDYLIYNPTSSLKIHILKIITLRFVNYTGLKRVSPIIDLPKLETFSTQLVLGILFWYIYGSFYSYLLFIIPLAMAKVINDIRVFIEHYDPELKTGALKKIRGVPVLGYFISAYGFDAHHEHHNRPSSKEIELRDWRYANNHFAELRKILRYA